MAGGVEPLVYPKKAFIAGAFLLDENGKVKTVYPYDSVYMSLGDVSDQFNITSEFNSELNKGIEIKWSVHEISIVLPIFFEKYVPLKPEYWENPTASYNDYHRVALFNEAYAVLPLFKLLVTPLFNNYEKKWIFNAAIPFRITAEERGIEAFMMHSDHPVDQKAEYAAIYTFGKPIRYNWKKQKILRKKFRNLATKN